ncbi:MAG TPA: nuclear transport factor 2 family protein [Myxococcota bacterium]|nr:nuclear transport factor 2 family protein [Myxococcota bacterium]
MSSETDRVEIASRLDLYAEALDRRQWERLREVFADDVQIDFGEWTATSCEQAVTAIRGYLDGCGPSQHLLGTCRIRIEGDAAWSLVYVRAFHVGVGRAAGKTYEMGGEYQDELRRRPEGWRIVKRRARVLFEQGSRDVLGPG